MKYVINGKFLSQKMTGVQRFQYEIICALDRMVDNSADEFILAKPKNAREIELKNIKVVSIGSLKGILWEQIDLFCYEIKNNSIGINLGNVSPFLKPDIVCVHDMNVKRNPKFYTWKYRIWNNINFFNFFHRAKLILTVSDFSKREIEKYYCKCKIPINVVENSWEHYDRITYNENLIKKFGIQENKYFFSMSSLAPNKNFKWIIEEAKQHSDDLFIVAGMKKKDLYGNDGGLSETENLKLIGYVSDEEAKALLKNCKAFIFPTLYEGFGIPPLEALSVGTDIIVSDIPVMHEVFGNAANYIDPYTHTVGVDQIKQIPIKNKKEILQKYSWKKSAGKLLQYIKAIK